MNPSDWDADVLIVGGGPAGCLAGIIAAQHGLRVTLFEAEPTIKRKVCGEFLCYEGVHVLNQAGLEDLVDQHQYLPGMGASITTNRGLKMASGFPQCHQEQPGGFCLNRQQFDQAMMDKAKAAGVKVLSGTRIVDMTLDHSTQQWHLTTRSGHLIKGDLLIGADGIRSFVAKSLGLTLPIKRPRLALRCFLPTLKPTERMIEMHLLPNGAYVGIDVVDHHEVNFSIVLDKAEFQQYDNAEAVFRHVAQTHPAMVENVLLPDPFPAIEAISPVTHRVKDCIGPHAALVGDAGGFLEPLTGEGIAIALWTAHNLAHHLVACHQAQQWPQRQAALKRYKHDKHQHYRQKWLLSKLFYQLIENDPLCDALCRFINGKPYRKEAFAGVINNTYTPLEGLRYLLAGPLLKPS